MTLTAAALQTVPSMAPFVCSVIGGDAGEPLSHIAVRKEAERLAGSGEFWWGLSAPLGADVEAQARQNGGALPALFSKSTAVPGPVSQVRIWEEWESVFDPSQSGPIPGHVIVTSGYNPNGKKAKRRSEPAHYALVCRLSIKLSLGHLGFCDLQQCRTTKNQKTIKYIVGARLLEKPLPLMSARGSRSQIVRSVAFQANLVGHCYVKLRNPRVLTQAQYTALLNYQPGDDWPALVKQLRP
jgi:hypothetical protein